MVDDGDAEHVNVIHETIHDAITTLDTDDDLAARHRQGIVADGLHGVGIVKCRVLVGGEGVTHLAEGGEGA